MTRETPLAVRLQSCNFSVRAALSTIMGKLAAAPISEPDRGSLELVLAEVLNNVVKHAFAGRSGGPIDVEIRCAADRLRCEIRDPGRPMPLGLLPPGDPAQVDGELDELPEGGFGWFLIRELATSLDYRRVGDVNRLRFDLPLRRGPCAGRRAS